VLVYRNAYETLIFTAFLCSAAKQLTWGGRFYYQMCADHFWLKWWKDY